MENAAVATTREIMATVLARDLVDGEWVEVGAFSCRGLLRAR